MTPFVLLARKKLPPESAPSHEQVYDGDRQLWVDKSSGLPLVLCMQAYAQPSSFGETTVTETREGVDQTEGTALRASQFGETTLTKTREGADQTDQTAGVAPRRASQFGETTHTATREGVDQTESAFQASQFGETINTRTREGVDQTEGTPFQASQFGETTLTDTREGADQTEGVTPLESHAPHSHF